MSNQEKPMSQRLTDVVVAADNLTQTVQDKIGHIDAAVATKSAEVDQLITSAETEFNNWKNSIVETINGIDVTKIGNEKHFSFQRVLQTGGWTHETDGPDSAYPYCSNPQPPYYINMLEFNPSSSYFTYGDYGDYFKIEFMMCHRGMYATEGYTDHLIFTGTSYQDSVACQLEVKKIANDSSLSVFISEPNNLEKEIPLTTAMEGTTLPVSYRSIGQGYNQGVARVSLKVDTRPHCGSTRAISVDTKYTSHLGQPSVNYITQEKPTWEQ
jgi:hypothetical protein